MLSPFFVGDNFKNLLWEKGEDEDRKEDGGVSQICIKRHLIGRSKVVVMRVAGHFQR